MLFKQGRSIKSVLATSNTGLSLIPALIDLVGLTLEDFLDFYFTMFTDANNSVDIEHGRSKEHKSWALQRKRVLRDLVVSYSGLLCSAAPWQACSCIWNDGGTIDVILECCGCHGPHACMCIQGQSTQEDESVLPGADCSINSNPECGSVQMAERGLVLKIDLEATSGANVASTYMGISEHLAAAQHGQSSSATNQRKVFKHHARCLDVLDGTDQPDRTVTIRPSSFLGRYTNIDGSELFPDPTAAGANPAAILRSAMLRLTLHTKHERCPDPSVKSFPNNAVAIPTASDSVNSESLAQKSDLVFALMATSPYQP